MSTLEDGNSKKYWTEKRKRRKEKKKKEKEKESKTHWRDGLTEEEITTHKEKLKRLDMWKKLPLEEIPFVLPRVIIDLSFTSFMDNKELRSVITQLSFLYGFLKRSEKPLELHFCSFIGDIKDMLINLQGFTNWRVFLHEESLVDLFSFDELVYLSPDAPNELTELNDDKIYVIGGIVDHNRLKVF